MIASPSQPSRFTSACASTKAASRPGERSRACRQHSAQRAADGQRGTGRDVIPDDDGQRPGERRRPGHRQQAGHMREHRTHHQRRPGHRQRGHAARDAGEHGDHADVEHAKAQVRGPLGTWPGMKQRLREEPAPHEHRVRGRAEHQQVQGQPLRHRHHPVGGDHHGRRQQVGGHDRPGGGVPDDPGPPGARARVLRPGQAAARAAAGAAGAGPVPPPGEAGATPAWLGRPAEVAQSVSASSQDPVRADDCGDDLAGQRQPVIPPAADPPPAGGGERPAVRGDGAARAAHDAGKIGILVQQAGNVRARQPVAMSSWGHIRPVTRRRTS